MNGDRPEIDKAMEVMLEGLNKVDGKAAQLYLSYVFTLVPTVVGKRLKELLMTASPGYESVAARYFSEWVDKGRAEGHAEGREEGRAEGEIEAILTVLDARGLDIPSEARERISRCSDLHLLEKWIRRAVTVTSVDELFD